MDADTDPNSREYEVSDSSEDEDDDVRRRERGPYKQATQTTVATGERSDYIGAVPWEGERGRAWPTGGYAVAIGERPAQNRAVDTPHT